METPGNSRCLLVQSNQLGWVFGSHRGSKRVGIGYRHLNIAAFHSKTCFWLFLKKAEVQAALGRHVHPEGSGLGWVRAATLMSPDGPVGPGACGLSPSEPPEERGQERGPRVTRNKSRDSMAAVRGPGT